MNVLIIEDEFNAAKELERLLLQLDPAITILGLIDSVENSIAFLRQHSPDLIFSDIQLADGMCFEIYDAVKVTSPIVFCTAYDDYMLEAFDTNAVSYILKPINEENVAKALAKMKTLRSAFSPETAFLSIGQLARQLKYVYKTSLLVEQREKIIPLQVKDIAYIMLENTIVTIVTQQNNKYLSSINLDELQKVLDPELFYRANRQFIINRTAIANIERYFSRKLITRLKIETPGNIIISKAKASDFLRWLEA